MASTKMYQCNSCQTSTECDQCQPGYYLINDYEEDISNCITLTDCNECGGTPVKHDDDNWICENANICLTTCNVGKGKKKCDNDGWHLSKKGASCDATCQAVGLHCDADKQSELTSCATVKSAFAEAGWDCDEMDYPCREGIDSFYLAGTPFFNHNRCYYLEPGTRSTCAGKHSKQTR